MKLAARFVIGEGQRRCLLCLLQLLCACTWVTKLRTYAWCGVFAVRRCPGRPEHPIEAQPPGWRTACLEEQGVPMAAVIGRCYAYVRCGRSCVWSRRVEVPPRIRADTVPAGA